MFMTINISKFIKIKYTVISVFHVDVQKSTETQQDMINTSELRQGDSLCWKNALHLNFPVILRMGTHTTTSPSPPCSNVKWSTPAHASGAHLAGTARENASGTICRNEIQKEKKLLAIKNLLQYVEQSAFNTSQEDKNTDIKLYDRDKSLGKDVVIYKH